MEDRKNSPHFDFGAHTTEHARHFTGREWVLRAIDDWLADASAPHLFLLTGHPGSGKTAVAARLYQIDRGEVAVPNGLSSIKKGFLSASHYCSAGDRRWINPHVFAESLATQLATGFPAFATALARLSSDEKVRIEVHQRIGTVHGQVAGVVVNRLDLSRSLPEDAFIRVVREPLEELCRLEPETLIVLLVDGLDESLEYSGSVGIVDLLSNADDLPQNVRLILTSRPETSVLRSLRRNGLAELTLSPQPSQGVLAAEAYREVLKDVQGYVERVLLEQQEVVAKLAPDFPLPVFVARVRDKSAGNFLYLRYLLLTLLTQQERISASEVDAFPSGLDAIYVAYLERLVGKGRTRWTRQYRRVLGLLAVAQMPLTEAQLADLAGVALPTLRKVLRVLRQLLDTDDSVPASERSYALYHRSFAELLINRDRAEEYWIDALEVHRRIADHYWSRCRPDSATCDNYGLNSLAAHLAAISDSSRLLDLISKNWRDARYISAGYTHAGFLADIDLAWQAAITQQPQNVLQLVRLQTARQVAREDAISYSDEDLEILVWLGREAEALGHARLRRDAAERAKGLVVVYRSLNARGDARANIAVIDEALATIDSISTGFEQESALSHVLDVLIEVGQLDFAASVTQSFEPGYFHLKAVHDIAVAFVLAGRIDESLTVAGSLSRTDDRIEIMAAMAAALAQLGDIRAKTVFADARRMVEHLIFDNRRGQALAAIAAALARAGKIDEAIATFAAARVTAREYAEQLRLLRPEPMELRRRSWNSVAKALVEASSACAVALAHIEDARADLYFEESRAMAETIRGGRGWDEIAALETIAIALADAGRLDKTWAVAISLRKPFGQDELLRVLAGRLARAGQIEEARALIDAIKDTASLVGTLAELAAELARIGDLRAEAIFAEARALVAEIESTHGRRKALRDIAVELARLGDPSAARIYAEAQGVMETDHDVMGRARALARVTAVLAETGCFVEARAAAGQIGESFDESMSRGEAPNVVALAFEMAHDEALKAEAVALAKAGQLAEAHTSAAAIREPLRRAQAFRMIAVALAESGQVEDARTLVASLEPRRLSTTDPPYRIEALVAIAVALARAGDNRADDVFSETRALVGTLDVPSEDAFWRRARALKAIAVGLAEAGRLDEALVVVEDVDRPEDRAAALTAAAAALARAGDSRADVVSMRARTQISPIEHPWTRAGALADLVAVLAEMEQIDDACALANEIEEPLIRGHAWANIAEELALAGQVEDALAALDKIGGGAPPGRALTITAKALAYFGRVEEAHVITERIEDAGARARTLGEVAAVLARAGHCGAEGVYTEARRVLGTVGEQRLRQSEFESIGGAMARAHRFDWALVLLDDLSLAELLEVLARWSRSFESFSPGLAVSVLREATDVASWIRTEWHPIHELLAQAEPPDRLATP